MDVGWHFRKRYESATRTLPARVAAVSDKVISRVPFFRKQWREPLNGQQRRREIMEEISASGTFDLVVETGTFRAATTKLLADKFNCSVKTCEANARYARYSQTSLKNDARIAVEFGDSRRFLRQLAANARRDLKVFAYLDAHWNTDLPLAEELEIIATTWANTIVMIDDFRVPGDDGYGYDDYGPGAALTEELLPRRALSGWSLFYPSAGSDQETGHKRGCCVLCAPQSGSHRWKTLRTVTF